VNITEDRFREGKGAGKCEIGADSMEESAASFKEPLRILQSLNALDLGKQIVGLRLPDKLLFKTQYIFRLQTF